MDGRNCRDSTDVLLPTKRFNETIGSMTMSIKRCPDEEETGSGNDGTIFDYSGDNRIKSMKYHSRQHEDDQPAVQQEVEVHATSAISTADASSTQYEWIRQPVAVKEEQVQLPKRLKRSLKRLKNLLKLPKARRWVYCEFFYSDIDRELLFTDHEFVECLQQSFPNLNTRQLRRAEWRQVRRLIGRPRRCSEAFFNSERAFLNDQRRRIQNIHSGVVCSQDNEGLIPSKIPKPLVVDSKVFARIRQQKDGIYAGTVDAVMDNSYRISFEKNMVPPVVIPDYEVMSQGPLELIPVSVLIETNQAAQQQQSFWNDISGNTVPSLATATTIPNGGQYPWHFIVALANLTKLLCVKKRLVAQIREMNDEAERALVCTAGYTHNLQEHYAKAILDLERVNKQLEIHLCGVWDYVNSTLVHRVTGMSLTDRPEALRKLCHAYAAQVVKNLGKSSVLRCGRLLELVTSLTAFLFQVRAFGQHQCDVTCLGQTMEQLKHSLCSENWPVFDNYVAVHFKGTEMATKSRKTTEYSSM